LADRLEGASKALYRDPNVPKKGTWIIDKPVICTRVIGDMGVKGGGFFFFR
jgi:hypothetical protein